MNGVAAGAYPEILAGGYSRQDGSVEFYGRVRALLPSQGVVLEFGAGRGWWREDTCRYRRELHDLRGADRFVLGVDVDRAIAENTGLDAAVLVSGDVRLPLRPASVDLAVADWVFEHLDQPEAFAAEMQRVIRPGGWLCARTPNRWGYVGIGARVVPNRLHTTVLGRLQPFRQDKDVFATAYRMNTLSRVDELFPPSSWLNATYPFNPDPGYAGRSRLAWRLLTAWQRMALAPTATNLFVFFQRQ